MRGHDDLADRRLLHPPHQFQKLDLPRGRQLRKADYLKSVIRHFRLGSMADYAEFIIGRAFARPVG